MPRDKGHWVWAMPRQLPAVGFSFVTEQHSGEHKPDKTITAGRFHAPDAESKRASGGGMTIAADVVTGKPSMIVAMLRILYGIWLKESEKSFAEIPDAVVSSMLTALKVTLPAKEERANLLRKVLDLDRGRAGYKLFAPADDWLRWMFSTVTNQDAALVRGAPPCRVHSP